MAEYTIDKIEYGGDIYHLYDTTYNEATNSTAGLMSVADKLKLDSITVSDIGTVGADSIRGEKNISVSITDGIATIGHSNTAVTSSNTQPSKNNSASSSTTLGFGDIIQFPYVTYDTYGHVTQKNIVAFQLPTAPSSTDTATNATNATYATYDASEVNKTTKTTIADKFILKSVGTTKGDIIYYSGTTPAPTRLAIGSEGQVLKVGSNGIPVWGTDSNDNSYHTSGSWSGVTYTATANGGAGELKFTLPTASASASGIINTDAQSFKGDKTFQSNTFRIRNANNDNNQAGSNPWITQLNLGDGNYVTVTEYKDDNMALRGNSILLNTASAFGVYDATKTYSVGNIVWYDKAYYKCTTAITTAEAWTAEHWTTMPSSGIMANANLNPWITGRYSLGTSSYKWNNIYTNSINGTTVPSIFQQTTQAVYPIKINAIGQITEYGSAVTIPTIPSNNVTGSGTSGYLVKWNGTNSITNGPQLGSSTTTYLRNDGSWATPTDTNTTYSLSGALSSHKFTSTLTAGGSGSGTSTSDFTLAAGTGITLTDNTSTRTITIASSVTNTDTLVTQTNTTGNAEYRLLFSANANDSDETTTARKSTYLRYNPSLKALVSSGEIRAEKGVFNKLIATDFTASTASIDSLTATNAKVIGLLDVEGDLHTNKWTNANIANVGGSFYISPTVSSTSTNAMSVTITGSANSRSLQVSGGTFETDVAKIYDSTNNSTHSVYSTGTTSGWPVGSHVMITGNIRSTTTGVDYPLGTLTGYLTAALSSSGFTVGEVNSNALESIISEIGTSNLKSYEISISMIEIGPKTSLKPIGIMMTSYGVDKSTYIDIYGGVRTDGKSNPNVRVGYLGGLPQVNNETPKGWGIYTDNGYFTGVIVSTAGKIGNWTIENTTNSSPTYGGALYTGSFGTDNGIFITPNYTSSTSIGGSSGSNNWTLTAGNKFGVTKTGELWANLAHIKGSIDASSFVVKNSQGIPIVNLSASGLQFGTEQAGITYDSTSDELDIKATTVYFGPLSADALIDEVRGGLYYQYTTDGITYDVWYADDEDKYYYINSSGQTQEVNKANLDVDSDENLITVRRDGLSSQLSQNRDDLQTYADRLKTEEDYSTELNNRLSANESWINNTGNNTANSWNTFQDSEYITLSDYFTNAFNTAYNNRIKGILVDTTVPFIKVFAPNEQNQTSTINQSAVVVYSDRILIKGQNNLALLDEERFAVNSIVSTNIMPAHIVFNEAAATLNIVYSFAIKGRSNHHMSIVKVASNT